MKPEEPSRRYGWSLDLWELPPLGSSLTGPARRLQRLGMDTKVGGLATCAAGGWAVATEGGLVLFFPG